MAKLMKYMCRLISYIIIHELSRSIPLISILQLFQNFKNCYIETIVSKRVVIYIDIYPYTHPYSYVDPDDIIYDVISLI